MDYEQKYKKALERAREELGSGCFDRGTVEYIFPELKESDDERISREITEFILTHRIDEPNDIEDTKPWLAWLEKQGKPKLAESEDERIRQAIIDTLKGYHHLGSTNGVLKENMIAWLEKQGEQKWSEEDEIGSDATIELLEYFINYAPEYRRPTIRRSIDWLKSLKKRLEEQ